MRHQDSDQWSGVKKALEGAVEETSIASIVKTAPNSRLGWPSRVDRSSIQRFLVRRASYAFTIDFLDRG